LSKKIHGGNKRKKWGKLGTWEVNMEQLKFEG
jgi:hypothetical protein